MRTWSKSEITSYCFFVWCESSSLFQFKTWGARGVSHVYCITELRGRLKCEQGDTS